MDNTEMFIGTVFYLVCLMFQIFLPCWFGNEVILKVFSFKKQNIIYTECPKSNDPNKAGGRVSNFKSK